MKVLEEYLNYIEKNKKLSKNTVASYNRDLKKYVENINEKVSSLYGRVYHCQERFYGAIISSLPTL